MGLPLDAISAASKREKSIRHGHPSTLHLWWSRKPLATARAILFAQLVDDPSSHPEQFPTLEEQDAERNRLHTLLARLVEWENSNDTTLLAEANSEIRKSNGGKLPAVVDPFAGGGSIPLEAQRLGLEAHASDLNPVSVIINKAMIEIPPKFAGRKPVFPGAAEERLSWSNSEGLAEDVRRYGEWMRDEAYNRLSHLYPTIKDENGEEHTVIAWLWARTVQNPNPANPIHVPLVSSWWLSKRKGHEAWVKPIYEDGNIRYEVVHSSEIDPEFAEGTVNRKGGRSIVDGTPIDFKYIRSEGRAGRMSSQLIAIVAEGDRGRVYIEPRRESSFSGEIPTVKNAPISELPSNPRDFKTPNYGLSKWSDLFTPRQLTALTTFSDLITEVREKVLADTRNGNCVGGGGENLDAGGDGAEAYADAIAVYLALIVSRTTDRSSTLASWDSSNPKIRNTFGRQALPMVWDFAEANIFSSSSGSFQSQIEYVTKAIQALPCRPHCSATQQDAAQRDYSNLVISTDPPYYDNIGYSDLSDYFYVWLRRSLRNVLPSVTDTILSPKNEELVANPYRHGGKEGAEEFFVEGFNSVFHKMRQDNPATDIPITVYYAYKQSDKGKDGISSTGWHTILGGLIDGGWQITATWPIRTEISNRLTANETNALASSICLACRPRPENAPGTMRRSFLAELRRELPSALRAMMQGGVPPVDLAQAAIGPGIGVFSKYSSVRDTDGSTMSVRDALIAINEILDEVLGEQEASFDPDTRFAMKWYRTYSWKPENSGIADQLARSTDTSIDTLVRGGIFEAKAGKSRLLSPTELAEDWDPRNDDQVSIWEATVRLAGSFAIHGIDTAADLTAKLDGRISLSAEIGRAHV